MQIIYNQASVHSKLPSFTGIARGGKAVLQLTGNLCYEEIYLKTNLSAADITRVSVVVNDDRIIDVPASFLQMREKYLKHNSVDGIYVIPFADISYRSRDAVKSTALVVMPQDFVTLEIEISPDVDPALAISLDSYAVTMIPTGMRRVIPRLYAKTMVATSSGENDLTGFSKSALKGIKRMHFMTDKISKLELKKDGREIAEYHHDVMKFSAQRQGRVSWQNGIFHYDPIHSGFMKNHILPTRHMTEFFMRLTTTEALNAIQIFVEEVEQVA